MPTVQVQGVRKSFGKVVALDHINLTAEDGKITVLLGPSGCGKTTLLRCIAGLEKPDLGEILLDDDLLTSTKKHVFIPPEKRDIGMVFQSYALWPHMKVFDNIAFPLKLRKIPKTEIKERVERVLDLLRLSGLQHRYPSELSGGQQQRVALARALVQEPKVLLLDEPLSNLDAKLREHTRFELRDLQRKLKITTIYVTHDQAEAMVLSDKMVVMDAGKIQQVGSPTEIYEKPANKFVADFIGTTNFIQGKIADRLDGFVIVKSEIGEIRCKSVCFTSGANVFVSIRPEHLRLSKPQPSAGDNTYRALVKDVTFLGDILDIRIQVREKVIRARVPPYFKFQIGEEYDVFIDPERTWAFEK